MTSATNATSEAERPGLAHDALFYRSDAEFLDGTVSFVLDGLDACEPMLAILPPRRIDELRGALGAKAEQVSFVPTDRGGPARLIPLWVSFVREHTTAGRSCRGLGEPVLPGARSAEAAEGQLHDALANLAFTPGARVRLRCPYDAAALDPATLREARRSHRTLVTGDVSTPSAEFAGVEHAARAFATPLPEPPGPPHTLAFGERDLPRLRDTVLRSARAAGVGPDRAEDLLWCVNEAAANSVRHGGGQGILRIWLEATALVCEVRDRGHIVDLLAGRVEPDPLSTSGRGLWTIHQLCDLAQVRSSAQGTVVRLYAWLS